MSIVGPRPHAIPFEKNYAELVEEIKLRHRVKPGITGWAQIHGLRGDVFIICNTSVEGSQPRFLRSCVVERKKPGQPKARKRFQFSKR